jgi:hypothetical protein
MLEAGKGFGRLIAHEHRPFQGSPNISSLMKLKRQPRPHRMFCDNACFAELKEIWDIAFECTRC